MKLALLVLLSVTLQAQTVNHGTQVFRPSATVAGSRVECAALPSAPVNGDIVCDSGDLNQLKVRSNGAWVTVGSGAGYPLAENAVATATYTALTSDCSKLVPLTFAGDTTVTIPAASGFSNTCEILMQPTGGNATLITGVSETVYRNQMILLRGNGSVWRVGYLKFTAGASGAITVSRDTAGVTSFDFDPSVLIDFNGTFNVGSAGNLRFTGANNATGTVVSRLVKLAAANTLTVAAVSETDEPLGVCAEACGNTGTAKVVFRGNVPVEADNTVNQNDWIVVGTTTAGRAKSNGATRPTSGYVLGRARTGASAGATFTLLLHIEEVGGGSSAFSALTSGTNTAAAMIVGAGASHRANAADATAPSKSGTSLPGTCTVGDTYIKTDAAAASQLHLCTATNIWTQQIGSDPFDFSVMRAQERFCGTSTVAGPTFDVGQYRWRSDALAGVSTLTLSGDVNHPCYWQIVTGTVSGNGTAVAPLSFTSQQQFGFAYGNDGTWEMRFVGRIDTIATTDFAFNVNATAGSDGIAAGSNVIRIKRLSGGSVFVFEACDGASACSSSNSTITPADATTFTLRMRSTTAGTILFSVNGETEVSRSANIPTVTLYPQVAIKTATTATRELRLFGWSFQKTGMTP